MKKVFALALSLVLLLSLAACGGKRAPASSGNAQSEKIPDSSRTAAEGTGGTQAEKFENKIALSIDKAKYDKEERIEVTMNFSDVDQDNAVIVIVNSELPHGQLTPAPENCEEHRWISDFSEIPFFLWAPAKDGLFDVRVYAAGNGEELASVTFAVGSATLPQKTNKPTESTGSRWFTDEVLAEMKLTGFTQPEGFEVLTDDELPDNMENKPYLRVIKGASKMDEYHSTIEKVWNLLKTNYGEVYTWNYYPDKSPSYKWETEMSYGGDPFYVWDGDTIRSVSFTFSTFNGVEGELLQIGLAANADDPRDDYDWQ